MEYFVLNNGVKMPALGLGTFLLSPKEAEDATYSALKCGYKLIDTANAYMNERGVGRGIKRSGVKREDIFLVTKLWPSEYENAEKAISDTLKRLDTDYIDLLILHQPVGNFMAAYRAMERAYAVGKVRALGLSNFPEELAGQVIEGCKVCVQSVRVFESLRKLLAPARISTLESLSIFSSFATKKEGFVALFFCGGAGHFAFELYSPYQELILYLRKLSLRFLSRL